jgi:hypothetical protein
VLESICRWIQSTASSIYLRESTWGFAIVGSLHVLGLAWFGGTVLFRNAGLYRLRRIGAMWMLATGALLFWLEPLKCYQSWSFRVKLVLLLALVFVPARRYALALWAAVILASQGIAFF